MNKTNNVTAKQTKAVGANLKNDIAAKAQETINKVKAQASKKAKVSENLSSAAEKVNQIGHQAADVLNTSSDYIKNFDLAETRQQMRKTIKRKPELGIAIAGIFGLLIGLLIGRRTLR